MYEQVIQPNATVDTYNFNCPFSTSLNEEQKSAVHHIVWGQNKQVPIILHGPPGTGKTRTLVASIVETVQGTNDYILVLAHSNLACDEITLRLIELLGNGELFRLYAKSVKKETVHSKIKPICNLHNNEFQFPSLECLYQYRVVVSTLLTAGCLVRAREEDAAFDSGHFARVFIDEAGCVHEPTTLIPIAGSYLTDCLLG